MAFYQTLYNNIKIILMQHNTHTPTHSVSHQVQYQGPQQRIFQSQSSLVNNNNWTMTKTSYIWSKFVMTLCFNSALLVTICILLWGNSSINYGIIIYNETREWSRGGLLDVKPMPAYDIKLYNASQVKVTYPEQEGEDDEYSIQTDQQPIYTVDDEIVSYLGNGTYMRRNVLEPKCPKGYQLLSGSYYGTNTICLEQESGQYNIGPCGDGDNQGLVEISEITESTISRINGTYLCYKNSKKNYHDLVRLRAAYVPPTQTDPSKTSLNGTNNSSKPNTQTPGSQNISTVGNGGQQLRSNVAGKEDAADPSDFSITERLKSKKQDGTAPSSSPPNQPTGQIIQKQQVVTQSNSSQIIPPPVANKYICGSMKDTNKQYGSIEGHDTCFLNDLYFQITETLVFTKQNQTLRSLFNNFNDVWSYQTSTVHDANNPIARIYLALSQPCVNINIEFMNRTKSIPLIYRNQNNNCDMYMTSYHTSYVKTNFEQSELITYSDNDLLKDIENTVPNFDSRDLEINNFRIYVKPYAQWSQKCQQVIPSTEFAEFAKDIVENEERYRVIMKLTSYFIGIEYVMTLILAILNGDLCQRGVSNVDGQVNRQVRAEYRKPYNVALIVCFFFTLTILSVIFGLYYNLQQKYFINNIEILSYANTQFCADGILAKAMSLYSNRAQSDQQNIRIGMISVGVVFLLNIANIILFTNVTCYLFGTPWIKLLIERLKRMKQSTQRSQSSTNVENNNNKQSNIIRFASRTSAQQHPHLDQEIFNGQISSPEQMAEIVRQCTPDFKKNNPDQDSQDKECANINNNNCCSQISDYRKQQINPLFQGSARDPQLSSGDDILKEMAEAGLFGNSWQGAHFGRRKLENYNNESQDYAGADEVQHSFPNDEFEQLAEANQNHSQLSADKLSSRNVHSSQSQGNSQYNNKINRSPKYKICTPSQAREGITSSSQSAAAAINPNQIVLCEHPEKGNQQLHLMVNDDGGAERYRVEYSRSDTEIESPNESVMCPANSHQLSAKMAQQYQSVKNFNRQGQYFSLAQTTKTAPKKQMEAKYQSVTAPSQKK